VVVQWSRVSLVRERDESRSCCAFLPLSLAAVLDIVRSLRSFRVRLLQFFFPLFS
jgi:hypothetical protein